MKAIRQLLGWLGRKAVLYIALVVAIGLATTAALWVRQVAAGTTPTQVRAQVLENANGSFAAVRTHFRSSTDILINSESRRLFSAVFDADGARSGTYIDACSSSLGHSKRSSSQCITLWCRSSYALRESFNLGASKEGARHG
ncbi:hypothetical protein [Sphingomonas sp. 2SG]|uniref:hypothetical protein n=1 Tax=Sphingomonas sp. 2SG TaxID=2502201 RepID=UPI0010F9FC91|nr:hypothetical protein [Sphingomonas sp. 2SG]